MKILIFGASGSGTTTLGKHLAERLNCTHLDVDNYYWKKTSPPFQVKIPLDQRNAALTNDFEKHKDVIVSGSLVSWGAYWETAFTLAVFVYLPVEARMERLQKREVERYGDLLFTDKLTRENSNAFLGWAKSYDDKNFDGRSKRIHEKWLKSLTCPIVELTCEIELNERVNRVLREVLYTF